MRERTARIAAAPPIDDSAPATATPSVRVISTCSDCRKLRRELKERDAKIERLLAALRRESYSMDQRVGPSGYEEVILKRK